MNRYPRGHSSCTGIRTSVGKHRWASEDLGGVFSLSSNMSSGVRVNNIAGGAFVLREREEWDRRNVATKQSQQTPYTVSGAFLRRINNAIYMPRPGGGLLVDCVVEELRWHRSNRIQQPEGTDDRPPGIPGTWIKKNTTTLDLYKYKTLIPL
ncbi:hypothetical protein C8J57DRAFT_1251995 [Mycena rebaudengoi]|nr:hypothetical protein C8J57DRAFT_1251995 [Mycena rebaudengoi]